MPISSLLFRKRPDTASANSPPQQLMHRALLPPPPFPPPFLLPASVPHFPNLPFLGLQTVTAPRSVLGGDRHDCVERGNVHFSSAPSFTSTPGSPEMGSDVFGIEAVLDGEEDNESDHGKEVYYTQEEVERGEETQEQLEQEEEEDKEETGDDDDDEEEEQGYSVEDDERFCWASYGKRSGVRRLPPPISVLAKAGEKRCLMPWVLRRSYEVGGRLVMREVKVENQEYLKSCRAGGRLTLKLVQLQEPESPSTPPPSVPTTETPPSAPISVRASRTPRSCQTEISTLSMPQSPWIHSSEERRNKTGISTRTAWPSVWSRDEDSTLGVHYRRRREATLAASSLTTLSSSLPEARTLGCYANARMDSLFGMLAAARMPPVHS